MIADTQHGGLALMVKNSSSPRPATVNNGKYCIMIPATKELSLATETLCLLRILLKDVVDGLIYGTAHGRWESSIWFNSITRTGQFNTWQITKEYSLTEVTFRLRILRTKRLERVSIPWPGIWGSAAYLAQAWKNKTAGIGRLRMDKAFQGMKC